MSEEMQKNEQKEKCSCKKLVVLVVLSLLISIAALATSIFALTNGAPSEKKVVISTQYDKGKSYEKALKTQKPMVVFFYTDWCGFCQRFAPTFDKITKKKDIKNNFAVAYVNCEKPENQKLMEEFNVTGFPTVFVINKDKKEHLDNGLFFGENAIDATSAAMLKVLEESK